MFEQFHDFFFLRIFQTPWNYYVSSFCCNLFSCTPIVYIIGNPNIYLVIIPFNDGSLMTFFKPWLFSCWHWSALPLTDWNKQSLTISTGLNVSSFKAIGFLTCAHTLYSGRVSTLSDVFVCWLLSSFNLGLFKPTEFVT